MNQTSEPVNQKDRILSIDVLRGFALMGILIVNMQSFAMILSSYNNPTAFGDLTGTNYFTWFITHVFFDMKMMNIFSMLFGAGIILMSDRAAKRTDSPYWLHCRRMLWLVLFGVLHAHLLWVGDILYAYGLCGVLVYWARNWGPRWQVLAGLALIAVPSLFMLAGDVGMNYMSDTDKAAMAKDWTPSAEVIQAEVETYQGGWLEQMKHRSPTALMFETLLFGMIFFWRASGLMLIGMALFKWKVFDASRSEKFYGLTGLIALLIGLGAVLLGVRHFEANEWSLESSMLEGHQFNYWASLAVSLGYICVIMLMCKRGWLSWLTTCFQAAGQMALTNYLMQTIICTTIFYGHGFGMFGQLSRTTQLCIVIAIWIFQLAISPVWLKRFRFGPFEWLWRSLVYWKRQPMRRSTS